MRLLLVLASLAAACGPPAPRPAAPRPATLPEAVIHDFERAVLTSQDAFLALFDFAAVGKLERLLHRYDVLGRANLTPQQMAEFSAEDATPFTAERERRNVGYFYALLGQRTVGRGGCARAEPVSDYVIWLGEGFEPLDPGLEHYEPLRQEVNAMIADGGLVAFRCRGGQGRLGLLWTRTAGPRGYDLIAIYDDVEPRSD